LARASCSRRALTTRGTNRLRLCYPPTAGAVGAPCLTAWEGLSMFLEAHALTKYYGSHPAVTDVTFALDEGEILGYLGPNGSGKSTTVSLLLGLISPTSGQILFRGEAIDSDLIEYRRLVGDVPEQPKL